MTSAITVEKWTDFLRDGRNNAKLEIPFNKQRNLISYLFRPDPGTIKQVDLCCGRGFGKSVLAIYIATMALSLSPNEIGLFLAPDWKRIRRVFLKKWRQLVPRHLYELNKTDQCITWLPTGSLLFYGPRNITGGAEMSEDSQLGQDATFVIDDEAALKCSTTFYLNTLATVREPSNVRFYLTLSTPRVGPYKRLVTSLGHVLFRGTSADNPYLPKDYVKNLKAQMGIEQARRELEGEFVALEGLIWKHANYDPDPKNKLVAWPNGNRHDKWTTFRKGEPWWVFCDLGSANGAYVVVQSSDSYYRGRRMFQDDVWVAVADLCPHKDASASRAFQRLNEEFGEPRGEGYGPPVAVIGGDDLGKTSDGDGKTVAYFARQVWGADVRVIPCSERLYEKQIQYDRLSFLMCSALKERRFAIARDFVSLDTESHRGVREMISEDAWPAEDRRRMSDFLPKGKDNIVQHTRDALLMGAATVMSPPLWLKDDNPTA